MRPTAMLIPAALALVAAGAMAGDAKDDVKKLQGEWVMASLEFDGQPAPDETVQVFGRKVEGDKYTVTITKGDDVKTVKGTYKLDPTKKPKAVDALTTDAEGKEVNVLGIYELDGDTHKICMAPPGADRPTEFATEEGSKRTLIVWKRVKGQ
jgi:uncharacterized protein (TIGR03067 family)